MNYPMASRGTSVLRARRAISSRFATKAIRLDILKKQIHPDPSATICSYEKAAKMKAKNAMDILDTTMPR